jgi:hypothetical protein
LDHAGFYNGEHAPDYRPGDNESDMGKVEDLASNARSDCQSRYYWPKFVSVLLTGKLPLQLERNRQR